MRPHFLFAAAALFIATPALAAETPEPTPAPIGAPGSVALAGQVGGSYATDQYPRVTTARSSLIVAPTFDVFVVRGLSLGASTPVTVTRFAYKDENGSGGWTLPTFQGFARIGYAIPLGKSVAFWPILRVGGGYAWDTEREPHAIASAAIDPRLVVNLSRSIFLTATVGSVQLASTPVPHDRGTPGFALRAETSVGIGGWL